MFRMMVRFSQTNWNRYRVQHVKFDTMIRIEWNETAFKIGNVKCPIWIFYIKYDTNMRVGPKKNLSP